MAVTRAGRRWGAVGACLLSSAAALAPAVIGVHASPRQGGDTVPAALDGAAGGAFTALALDRGNEIYAGQGARLVRYRAGGSGESGLVEVAATRPLDGLVHDVAVDDGVAYLALETGFQTAFDRGPILETGLRVPTFGTALSVATMSDYAYVTLGFPAAGVQVFEVSEETPKSAGIALEDTAGIDVAIAAGLLFVSSPEGVTVASLARPDRPTKLGVFVTMPAAGPLAADDSAGVVLAGGSGAVWVIDGRAPLAPAVTGSVPVTGTITALAASAGRAIATMSDGRVLLLDYTNTAAPAVTGEAAVANGPMAAVLSEDVAVVAVPEFLATVGQGSNPVVATVAESFRPVDVSTVGGAGAGGGSGPIYVAAGNRGLAVLELPCCLGGSPRLERFVELGSARAVSASPEWVGVLTIDSVVSLHVGANPYSPRVIGTLPMVGSDLAVTGRLALVSGGNRVTLLNLNGATGPELLGTVGDPTWQIGELLASPDGPIVYAADRGFGLRIFLTEPVFREVGRLSFPPPVTGSALALEGSKLHMAAGPAPGVLPGPLGRWPFAGGAGRFPPPPPPVLERMIAVDVSDPALPAIVSQGEPLGWPSAAAAAEGRLFIASGVEPSYPMRLVISGDQFKSLTLPAIARGAAAAGPQVALAAGDAGVLVAHAQHAAGPLPSPTAWATATDVAATPTATANAFTVILPLVRSETGP